jgi:hypothetical protein
VDNTGDGTIRPGYTQFAKAGRECVDRATGFNGKDAQNQYLVPMMLHSASTQKSGADSLVPPCPDRLAAHAIQQS